jgi:hypothetical protein
MQEFRLNESVRSPLGDHQAARLGRVRQSSSISGIWTPVASGGGFLPHIGIIARAAGFT